MKRVLVALEHMLVTIVLLVVSHAAACYACWSPPHHADTQPPKQKGQSPAEESADHSADANISDRDPEVDASVKQTREGKQGQDGKLHILIAVFQQAMRNMPLSAPGLPVLHHNRHHHGFHSVCFEKPFCCNRLPPPTGQNEWSNVTC